MTRRPRKKLFFGFLAVYLVGVGFFYLSTVVRHDEQGDAQKKPSWTLKEKREKYSSLFWAGIPNMLKETRVDTGKYSNMSLGDYAGPASCEECHKDQYDAWLKHPHRFMNAIATRETVHGDFSERANMTYLGGTFSFYHKDDQYFMELVRGEIRRTYSVERTIGSRFLQYYVGKQIEGPEPPNHPVFQKRNVLPAGYWLSAEEWIPRDDSHQAGFDGNQMDPFKTPVFREYSRDCSICHTTLPLGDWFLRIKKASRFSPRPIWFDRTGYLADEHSSRLAKLGLSSGAIGKVVNAFGSIDPVELTATLGISCEACHGGCKDHVAEPNDMTPRFFPNGPHFYVDDSGYKSAFGRTPDNLNWICARCHGGEIGGLKYSRRMNASNSAESIDAESGSCYSELTCVHCHEPHHATGKKWSQSPAEDDRLCIQCHLEFDSQKARMAHSHHLPGSEGSRCMNCHMPRLTEGFDDFVRTHTIFSPTEPEMIHANEPNACNLCHLDKPIRWTTTYLKEWYGATFSEEKIKSNYPQPDLPVGLGWLRTQSQQIREVAGWALAKSEASWALRDLVDALDDPYVETRRFVKKGLEEMQGIRLKDFGYRHYQTKDERKEPLSRIRKELLTDKSK